MDQSNQWSGIYMRICKSKVLFHWRIQGRPPTGSNSFIFAYVFAEKHTCWRSAPPNRSAPPQTENPGSTTALPMQMVTGSTDVIVTHCRYVTTCRCCIVCNHLIKHDFYQPEVEKQPQPNTISSLIQRQQVLFCLICNFPSNYFHKKSLLK